MSLNMVMANEEEWEGKSVESAEWHDGETDKKSRVRQKNN